MVSTHTELARDAASPLSTQAAEIGWTTQLVTNSGLRFQVRPARPADEQDLAAFFRSLPPEDLRHRFLTGLREVGHDRLQAMVRNDDPHTINFLAIDEPSNMIIATAMLVATKDYSEGEFALSTRPEWKQKGISWTLLGHLVRYAEAAGIARIKSIETSDDARALQLEREQGFAVHLSPEDSSLMIAEKVLSAPR
jgi:acetyltransferase